MKYIDLRSDTVTLPTPAMREAMRQAELGDDVYGEDPTINRLQEMGAALVGKEAGLFVPSGTMGNLAAILAHCGRGDEVILGAMSHTFLYEAGGISALGSVHSYQIPNQPDGTLDLDAIRNAIRDDDSHQPITRLVSLENTHNRCGGVALTPAYTRSVAELAQEHGLLLHLDGARIFNAAASLNVPVIELTQPVDSVTFCLSKGLCAPVGSLLCGSNEFIARAHRIRKQLGGGMRQAGVLAAAGIVALETVVPRLSEDHCRAQQIAAGLANLPGVVLDPGTPQTNMIFMNLSKEVPLNTRTVVEKLEALGVLVAVVGSRRFRLVTHYWIDEAAGEQVVEAFRQVVG